VKTIEEIRLVAVLGAGTMGAGIAQVAAQAGYRVNLQDVTREHAARGKLRMSDSLAALVVKGKMSGELREEILARIEVHGGIPETVRDADVVVEAAPEDLALKRDLFRTVCETVPREAIVATNTSSLSITAIAETVPGPERFIGLHFFNPPPVMKLLEIVKGEETAQATVDTCRALAVKLGKEAIVVRDSPGFASSRLGVSLGLEAMRMLEEGVASAEDIDKAMVLGYRHPMGPLELTDLVGLDVRLAIAEHLARELDDRRFAPPDVLRRLVREGHVGKKSGRGFYRWTDAGKESGARHDFPLDPPR
jgi:3-hydroxybutyryl-CoA dehydrogenase